MTTKGYRFCILRVPREGVANALLVLQRYAFVEPGASACSEGVAYVIDLSRLPTGDGPAAEAMVIREIERAVSLHSVGEA